MNSQQRTQDALYALRDVLEMDLDDKWKAYEDLEFNLICMGKDMESLEFALTTRPGSYSRYHFEEQAKREAHAAVAELRKTPYPRQVVLVPVTDCEKRSLVGQRWFFLGTGITFFGIGWALGWLVGNLI